MPRLRSDNIRRQQLIDATISSIQKHGLEDVTVTRIAAEVGLSSGNIHYYFGGKDGLLEATMRKLFGTIRERTTKNLISTQSAQERIKAVVRANFAPEIYRPEFCRAWLNFLAGSASVPRLRRIERVNARRIRSTIRHALLQILPRPQALVATEELVAVIDGLWVRGAQQGLKISPASAEKIAIAFLDQRLRRDLSDGRR
jgi:TetR/AcrR family transcriptional regulator, transcriptional repressor of bet genes